MQVDTDTMDSDEVVTRPETPQPDSEDFHDSYAGISLITRGAKILTWTGMHRPGQYMEVYATQI